MENPTTRTEARVPVKHEHVEDMSALPPHLQMLADRYGRELYNVAIGLAACNLAMNQLMHFASQRKGLRPPTVVACNFLSDTMSRLCAAKGWTMDQLMEVIMDIGRAKALAGQQPYKGRIIVPS